MTEIFVSLYSTLELFQIFAPKPFENFKRFDLKRSLIVMALMMFIVFMTMSLIPAQTFAEYSRSIFGVMSGCAVSFIIVVFYWHIPNIFELLDDLKSGIEMREDNPESKAIYKESNELIEMIVPMITITCQMTVHTVMASNFGLALVAYFTTGLDDYDYNFFFAQWFPFRKSLYEYLFEFIINYVGSYLLFLAVAVVMNVLITMILTTMAYVKDLQAESMNVNAINMAGRTRWKLE